jgi:hypothetical protein
MIRHPKDVPNLDTYQFDSIPKSDSIPCAEQVDSLPVAVSHREKDIPQSPAAKVCEQRLRTYPSQADLQEDVVHDQKHGAGEVYGHTAQTPDCVLEVHFGGFVHLEQHDSSIESKGGEHANADQQTKER